MSFEYHLLDGIPESGQLSSDMKVVRRVKEKICMINVKKKKITNLMIIISICVRIILVTVHIILFSQARHKQISFMKNNHESLSVIFLPEKQSLPTETFIHNFFTSIYDKYEKLSEISFSCINDKQSGFLICADELKNQNSSDCVLIESPKPIAMISKKIKNTSLITIKLNMTVYFFNDIHGEYHLKCYTNIFIINFHPRSNIFTSSCDYTDIKCHSNQPSGLKFEASYAVVLGLLTIFYCCVTSYIALFTIMRDVLLIKSIEKLFKRFEMSELCLSEKFILVNRWPLVELLSNILITIVTITTVFYNKYDQFNSDVSSIVAGVSLILSWSMLIRFFNFDPNYGSTLRSVYRVIPDVLRYLACVAIVYVAFLMCGWVGLGHYHPRFSTWQKTALTLFATLNGDDIYATFNEFTSDSFYVILFGNFYLYCSVILFMYFVLSSLISIVTANFTGTNLPEATPSPLAQKLSIITNLLELQVEQNQEID